MVMTGLAAGTTHTVVIQWDTTQSEKHALDYITTFNRTIGAANPCFGVTGCSLASPGSAPILADQNITSDPNFTMLPGHSQILDQSFTLYGGSIASNGVGGYVKSGSYATSSSTSISIQFTVNTSNSTGVAVLAWGGHIATKADWGETISVID